MAEVAFTPRLKGSALRTALKRRQAVPLTGWGELPDGTQEDELTDWSDTVRLVCDGMVFCQKQSVITTEFLELHPGEDLRWFPEELPTDPRRNYTEGVIRSDSWSPGSRSDFLALFVRKVRELREDQDPHGTPLQRALYRVIEMSRLGSSFWEINHYLLFTGLEILARDYSPDQRRIAISLSSILRAHGFEVSPELAQEFASARNAAFHQGHNESMRSGKKLNAIHQLFSLEMLLTDLCLKLLGFDDSSINWNRWRNRNAFC